MKKSKFYQLFTTLTKTEIKAFDKHLQKVQGKQQHLSLILAYFKKHGQLVTNDNWLDKNYALQKIFGQDKMSKRIFNNLLSDLYLALEEFLLWQKFQLSKKSFAVTKLRLDIWKERKLDTWFERDISHYKKQLQQEPRDMWYHYKLMYLNNLSFFSVVNENTKLDFSANLDHLELFFTTARLKYYLIEINRFNILDEPIRDYLSLETIYNSGKLNALKEDVFTQIYLNAISLLTHKKEIEFYDLKSKLFNSTNHLASSDQLIILMVLLNYVSLKMRQGNTNFILEKIQLFQYGLDSGLLLVDNYLDGLQLMNLINLACVANELPLANELKDKWGDKTTPKERLAVKKIIAAMILFHESKYGLVLENLRAIKYHNEFFAIRAKLLVLLSMMMTQENSQLVLDYCQALNTWLRRENTMSKVINLSGKNTVKLVKLYYQKRNIKDFNWAKTIQDTSPLFHAQWFKNQFLKNLKDDLMP